MMTISEAITIGMVDALDGDDRPNGCDGQGNNLNTTCRTIPEARQWYSLTKTRIVKEQAAHALGAGDINGDVYQALITREW